MIATYVRQLTISTAKAGVACRLQRSSLYKYMNRQRGLQFNHPELNNGRKNYIFHERLSTDLKEPRSSASGCKA